MPSSNGAVTSENSLREDLLVRQDKRCAGCNRRYDDKRIWELAYKNPRRHHRISNRILLCPPCHRIMDDTLTLIELCERNEEEGWMTSLGNWVESRTLDVLGEFRYRWLLPGLAQQQSADVLVQFAVAWFKEDVAQIEFFLGYRPVLMSVRLDDGTKNPVMPQQQALNICLLYTSPSPRD